jgi:translation elongation factor EF-4
MLFISAKEGKNVDQVFDAIVNKISPPPIQQDLNSLTAFLFDARYVPNRGVACLIKIMGGGPLDF